MAGAQQGVKNWWTEDQVLALKGGHAQYGPKWTVIKDSKEWGLRLEKRNVQQCGNKWKGIEAARAAEVSRSINHTLPPPLNAASPAPSAVSA